MKMVLVCDWLLVTGKEMKGRMPGFREKLENRTERPLLWQRLLELKNKTQENLEAIRSELQAEANVNRLARASHILENGSILEEEIIERFPVGVLHDVLP